MRHGGGVVSRELAKSSDCLSNISRKGSMKVSANMGVSSMATELSYLIAANKVIRDEHTKNPTFVDVFTVLQIPPNVSAIFPTVTIAGRLLGVGGGLLSILVKIVDSEGKIVAIQPLSGILVPGDAYITALFPPVKFDRVGRYFLKVAIDGKDIEDNGRFYIDVIKP